MFQIFILSHFLKWACVFHFTWVFFKRGLRCSVAMLFFAMGCGKSHPHIQRADNVVLRLTLDFNCGDVLLDGAPTVGLVQYVRALSY